MIRRGDCWLRSGGRPVANVHANDKGIRNDSHGPKWDSIFAKGVYIQVLNYKNFVLAGKKVNYKT